MDNRNMVGGQGNVGGQGIASGQSFASGQGIAGGNLASNGTGATASNLAHNAQPKKTKKIWWIVGGVVAGAAVITGGAVALMSVTGVASRVDYGSSYRAAKTVDADLNKISASGKCREMVDYVRNTTADATKYEGYIAKCNEVAVNVDEIVGELGTTEGVKQVPEAKAKFDEFRQQLMAVIPDEVTLQRVTGLYQTMHKFVLANDETRHLSSGEKSEQTYREVANILINSGDAGLKSYGEEWLTKKLAWWQKVQKYEGLDTRERRRITLREEASKMDTELKQWERENLPESMEQPFLDGMAYREMYVAFSDLQKLIIENYEQNYDDSGDCTKILDEVICY